MHRNRRQHERNNDAVTQHHPCLKPMCESGALEKLPPPSLAVGKREDIERLAVIGAMDVLLHRHRLVPGKLPRMGERESGVGMIRFQNRELST